MNYKKHKRIKNKIFRARFNKSNALYYRNIRKTIRWLHYAFLPLKNLPPIISEELIGVQPMDGPTGQVFHLNIIKNPE